MMRRRRFIRIVATAVAGSAAGLRAGAAGLAPVRWSGYALGAGGSVTLFAADPAAARKVLRRCLKEVRRLEAVFSLYDHRSELCRLNREGRLLGPSGDWLPLLDLADSVHRLTGGLFDPTVQPLWKAYREHFDAHPDCLDGPDEARLASALGLTGWAGVERESEAIRFARPGMQLSLNGIAQGYITDRVADLLREAGYANVLIELGETRALGQHPEGRAWQVGIRDAANPGKLQAMAELSGEALATSGGYGSPLSADGRFHHLIHPRTGRPETRWSSISVIAPSATEADALSTGLAFATVPQIERLLAARPDLRVLRQA